MSYYDQEYFDGGKGYSKYDYSGQYDDWAENIINLFHPRSVLDVGCAKGFLVQALMARNVPTWGIDVSEYAIEEADSEIADRLFVWDITSPKQIELPKVDLVISMDTFEHIPEDKLHLAQMFMLNHGDRYFIRVATPDTPDWQHDASHITIKPLEWWHDFWEEAVFEESK